MWLIPQTHQTLTVHKQCNQQKNQAPHEVCFHNLDFVIEFNPFELRKLCPKCAENETVDVRPLTEMAGYNRICFCRAHFCNSKPPLYITSPDTVMATAHFTSLSG